MAHQYIRNVHGLANGIVSVNAYGVLGTTTFPLAFRFYKPQGRLKPDDVFQSKPQLAIDLIEVLPTQGFHFSLVLADSLFCIHVGGFTSCYSLPGSRRHLRR